MSRVWEIIENSRTHGSTEEKVTKAYECGYEEGYEDAMRDVHSQMGERSYRIRDQYTGKDPGAWSEESRMGQRESMDYRGNMHYRMNERRMRDSMGRYK